MVVIPYTSNQPDMDMDDDNFNWDMSWGDTQTVALEQWTEERRKGRSLPETDPKYAYRGAKVPIYRACVATEASFKPMDYVTLNFAWAKGHADHVEAVEEEPAHVIRARVPADQVFEAYNSGEYFYDGPVIPGDIRYRT